VAGSQTVQTVLVAFHQLDSVFRLHAVEDFAVFEVIKIPGA
jgi:hypothetical protein